MKRAILFSLFLLPFICTNIYSQALWDCDGSVIIYINGSFYINRTVPNDNNVSLEELPLPYFGNISAIAYRRTDNCIYGIDNNANPLQRVFKLSPTGDYEIIYTIPDFEGALLAATMSFDDRFLILSHGYNLIFIDVTDPNSLPMFIPYSQNDITFAFGDISLDVITGKLYGWSRETNSLVVINPNTGEVKNTFTTFSSVDILGMGASAFVDNQTLFSLSENSENWILGFFHPTSENLVSEIFTLPVIQGITKEDACSCLDFDIAYQQWFSTDTIQQCQKLNTTIHIANRSTDPLAGSPFVLKDSFPEGVIIEEVLYNPYAGELSGIGTNQLLIEDFVPHFGIDSIVLQLAVTDSTVLGMHSVQAVINGFEDIARYPEGQLLSDNPLTYASNPDPTPFTVLPTNGTPPIADFQYYICPDSSLLLDPLGEQQGYDFIWDNGSTTPQRLIETAGQYMATLTDACSNYPIILSVDDVYIDANIGLDQSVNLSVPVLVDAQIDSDFPILSSQWFINDSLVLSCTGECLEFNFTALEDIDLKLIIKDQNNCQASDKIRINTELALFAPNVFSPNQDGLNDYFYLQTEVPLPYAKFAVFDRWGGLVFEQKNGITNDPLSGWDGFHQGKEGEASVYVWQVTLDIKGESYTLSGEVLLIR